MGLIRKTLSISTLGLVRWKGKKELLAEAEEELAQTKAGLARTRAELDEIAERRQQLEDDLSDTRSTLSSAELEALRDARRAHRKGLWRGRLQRRKGVLGTAKELAAPLVASTLEAGSRVAGDAEPVVDDVRGRSRKARKRAEKQADEARKRAEKRAEELRARAERRSDDLRDRAGKRAADLRDRAERRADELRYRTTGRSKRFGTRFRLAGRKAAATARHRADDVREAATEARQAVSARARHHD